MTLQQSMEKLLDENKDSSSQYADGVMDMYNLAKEAEECKK